MVDTFQLIYIGDEEESPEKEVEMKLMNHDKKENADVLSNQSTTKADVNMTESNNPIHTKELQSQKAVDA